MTTASHPKTLRELSGLPMSPPSLADAVLVIIDAQREYVDGRLPLDGIGLALDNIEQLLTRSRRVNGKIVHVVHQGRPGGTFDLEQNGRIIDQVVPLEGEPVVAKTLPNAFTSAEFRDVIGGFGDRPLVFAGFMTHMCISATARAALDAGMEATVAGDACATRPLPSATTESVIPSERVHDCYTLPNHGSAELPPPIGVFPYTPGAPETLRWAGNTRSSPESRCSHPTAPNLPICDGGSTVRE